MSTIEENHGQEEDPVATVLAIEHHLYNMGKALACPLCLSTLKTPTLLPCNHAFCKHCITEYFDPKHNRKIDSASGKHLFKNNCPICKTPASKRGITESTMLVGLVRAYKQALRSFGQTPVVYDETIAMTQIEETVCFSQVDEEDDGNDDDKGQDSVVDANHGPVKEGKKKAPTLRDCHQHLEVSRGVHNVLKRAVDSLVTNPEGNESKSTTTTSRLEEMEKQNKLRRLNNLLLDQEKVVKVNEKALVRAAVSKQKKKNDSVSSSTNHSFESNGHVENDSSLAVVENKMDNGQETTVANNSDDETTMGDSSQNDASYSFTQNILDQAQNAMQRSNDLLNEENSKPEDVGCPHNSENNSQAFFSAPEPEPISCVGKDEIMTSQECYERAMEDARENEAADRSCEWLDKENEVLTQDVRGGDNDDVGSSTTTLDQNDRASQKGDNCEAILCDKFFSATSQTNEQSQDGAHFKSSDDVNRSKEDHLSVGDIVQVEDRTWPGVNKRGGVARITKVHHGAGVKYDVAYVLGGKEKHVDGAFVRLHKEPSEESPSILNVIREDASIKSTGSRKSYRVGEKKIVQEWVAQIEKEEELKAKLAEKSIDTNVPDAIKKSDSKLMKKYNEQNSKTEPSQKIHKKNKSNKIKPLFFESSRDNGKDPSGLCATDSTTPGEISQPDLTKVSSASIIERALANFNSNLQLNNDSNTPRTLYLTTSSIGKAGEALVKQMISEVNGGVKLKLLKDFNPYKTNILITASSGQSSYGGLISKLRTMKAMRSSLSSIPIVSLEWVKNCISERIVLPLTVDISVTALPTKLECLMSEPELVTLSDTRDRQTASLGVLALALLHQGVDEPNQQASSHRLFSNTSVLLCGTSWKSSTTKTKDVQLLLREGGADIIPSASQAVKYIDEDLVEIDSATKRLVLLCDESESNATDGITSNLKDAVHNCLASNSRQMQPRVFVVNMNWLFDSISCASCLDPRLYEPSSPNAGSLWNLYFSNELK